MKTTKTPSDAYLAKHFSQWVLEWYHQFGRKDLPWQKSVTPYRTWVSEIMLQQTQVTTVIPYFKSFMQTFPSLKALAEANEDQVLHQWTGLGYYSRARNLHKTAQILHQQHNGRFPKSVEALCELPGIGRSTAGAILSLAMDIRAPILDGNVKRVLTRFLRVQGWTGDKAVLDQLWDKAELLTPREEVGPFTQAMMDLGATLCTRSNPQCGRCPLKQHCQGYRVGDYLSYPTPKPKKAKPEKACRFLILQHEGQVWLEKRPSSGIWGGLWCFPQFDTMMDVENHLSQLNTPKTPYQTGKPTKQMDIWPTFRHTFSHYHLDIEPVVVPLKQIPGQIMEQQGGLWYNLRSPESVGLAAPVKKLIKALSDQLAFSLE